MAGPWIKFECATPDKPEVWALAEKLEIDPDAVVGKLCRVWCWFDQHTEEGNAPSVTKSLLDRIVGVPGFCSAMISVRWMTDDGNRIEAVNFAKHNGKTAKKRALGARRSAECKARSNASGNAKGNAQSVTDSVTTASPRIDKSSDTTYQGAAPPEPVDNSPPPVATDPPPDPVKILFDTGVSILTAAGVTEQKARQAVGQLRKTLGDGPALEAIQRSADKTDPLGYLRKVHHTGGADAAWREVYDWLAKGKPKDFEWTDPKAETVAKACAGEMHAQSTRDCERIFKREYAGC